jgi:hypothetical protein
MSKKEMHELTRELAYGIEKELPEGIGFVLILAESKFGKAATNMTRPLLARYLANCANAFESGSTSDGLSLIEIPSEKFNR